MQARGGFMESLVPELIAMPDEDAKAFLRLALTSEPAQEFFEKTSRGRETRSNPFGTKGALIHPCGRVRSAEGFISAQGTFPALRYGGFAATRGCTPVRRFAAIPATPHKKQYTRPGVCTIFAVFYYPIREVIPIAIYHCNIGIVSEEKGKSAVAAAAYRSGEKITNEWDGNDP